MLPGILPISWNPVPGPILLLKPCFSVQMYLLVLYLLAQVRSGTGKVYGCAGDPDGSC